MSQFDVDILYAGTRNSLFVLEADGFNRLNFIPGVTTNDILSAATGVPTGVLGGSVAGIAGNLVVGGANASKRPLGIYIKNAAGNPFENSPTVASGVAAFVNHYASLRVFIWETHTSGGVPQTYNPGDLLWASANGFLTKETNGGPGGHPDVVGVVVKAPSAADLSLALELRL